MFDTHSDRDMFTKFLAITSINTSVVANVTLAKKAYRQYIDGRPFRGFLPMVIEKLEVARDGQAPQGRKIYNFYKALMGVHGAVVVDRWILRAYGFKSMTPGRYDYIERHITRLAKEEGFTPREYQAMVWGGVKTLSPKWRSTASFADHMSQLELRL